MTCPYRQGKCRHIGEALPYTISPMHHHKIRQLGRQHASCHLQCLQRHLSHRTSRRTFVGLQLCTVLARMSDVQTGSSVCTGCKPYEKKSMLSIVGCFAFRLLIILARKQLTASLPCFISSLTMTKDSVVLLSVYADTDNRVTCDCMVPVTLM